MRDGVKEDTDACILCIISQNVEHIPRPIWTALYEEMPNEVIRWDTLCLRSAENQIEIGISA